MNQIFINRIKSFFWRFGIAIITFGLSWLSENIGLLELPLWTQGIIALIFGEVSKWWANKQTSLGRTFFGKIKAGNTDINCSGLPRWPSAL